MPLLVLLLLLALAACSNEDNTRERVHASRANSAPLVGAAQYAVYLASDNAQAVEAVDAAIERLNDVLGFDAFAWGAGAAEPAEWTVTIRLDDALNGSDTAGVTAGSGTWCDVALAPDHGLNRFVVQHEFGHCFDFEHAPARPDWMYFAPDARTDHISEADIETMRDWMYERPDRRVRIATGS